MNDNPAIITGSFVNSDGTDTASSGQADAAKLHDRDLTSAWRSAAGGQVTFEHLFKLPGTFAVKRNFDTLLLLGHNLLRWRLEAFDGSAFQRIENCDFSGSPDLNPENTVAQFLPISSTKARIVMDEPKDGSNYRIGEWILGLEAFRAQEGLFEYQEAHPDRDLRVEAAEGSLAVGTVPWTDFNRLKYAAQARFDFLTENQRDVLKAIKDSGKPFLWWPEPISRPERIFQVHWIGQWRQRFTTTFKGSGLTVDLELREV